MRLGADVLATRGSGGARLVVSGRPIESSDALVSAGRHLASELVARSSTLLEISGQWAGAFTSYIDVTPEQLPKAVAGCWASAFSVETLERQEAAGVTPGSFEMAVLVQPALHPEWGGAAELRSDGSTIVHGIQGPPAPLLEGWVAGYHASRTSEGSWEGDLTRGLESRLLDRIAQTLQQARSILGANRCEWAVQNGDLWLLQLNTVEEQEPETAPTVPGSRDDWMQVVRALMSAPGPLGAELVLPWGLRGVPSVRPSPNPTQEHLRTARLLSRELASQAWGLSADSAIGASTACLDGLLGADPEKSLETIRGLGHPDRELAAELMSLVHGIRHGLADRGAVASAEAAWHLTTEQAATALEGDPISMTRVGTARWEPLISAVVLTHGDRQDGNAASPGLGAGLLEPIDFSRRVPAPAPRSVLYAEHAAPVLSQLLWDAAGMVTRAGSVAAHLFESARSLGVPAVTGIDLRGDRRSIVAVDGFAGVVATIDLNE